MTQIKTCANTGFDYIDFDGHRRLLASIPSFGKMAAMMPNYEDSAQPMFTLADITAAVKANPMTARRQTYNWIFDQNGFGSCVADGWTGGLTRARALRGLPYVKLSPGYLYSQINGGSDNGAVISEGGPALMSNGTCEYSIVGDSPIYTRQMPATAKASAANYKLGAMYHCTSWLGVLSALMTGEYIAVYGYMVGNNFMHADQYGVAGHDRGPGNHCNHGQGVALLADGRLVIDDVNSWGTSFMAGGFCYIDEQHLFGGGDQPDVCVITAPVAGPNDPDMPAAKV